MRRVTTHGCAAETESSSTRSSEIGPLRASEIRSCAQIGSTTCTPACKGRPSAQPQRVTAPARVGGLAGGRGVLEYSQWAGGRAQEGY